MELFRESDTSDEDNHVNSNSHTSSMSSTTRPSLYDESRTEAMAVLMWSCTSSTTRQV